MIPGKYLRHKIIFLQTSKDSQLDKIFSLSNFFVDVVDKKGF